MSIESVVKSNGLYSVTASEEGAERKITYRVAEMFDYNTKELYLDFTSTEYMKEVPADIRRRLGKMLQTLRKEF